MPDPQAATREPEPDAVRSSSSKQASRLRPGGPSERVPTLEEARGRHGPLLVVLFELGAVVLGMGTVSETEKAPARGRSVVVIVVAS